MGKEEIMNKIYPRSILPQIQKYMDTRDILVILGSRQTGKSTLLHLLMQSIPDPVYFDLEDFKYRELCDAGVEQFIRYLHENGLIRSPKTYIFLDEIQLLTQPSSFLKLLHDHNPEIKLIVTGSSTFAIRDKFKDSLVGRTVNFELYPLSFQEFLIFKESRIDISREIHTPQTIEQLKDLFREYVRYGGYPKIVLTPEKERKEVYLRQIVDTYLKADIRDLAQIRQIDKFNKLLRILAEQSGSMLNITELSNTTGISKQTLEEYLFILENTYVIKRISPFAKNLRKELFKRSKLFFLDTGLTHVLSYNTIPEVLLGNSFETSVFCELIKNISTIHLHYWRTKDKKEIDFVLEDGKALKAIEVKLNSAKLNPRHLFYFQKEYSANIYAICLELPRKIDNLTCLYPWEIYRRDLF